MLRGEQRAATARERGRERERPAAAAPNEQERGAEGEQRLSEQEQNRRAREREDRVNRKDGIERRSLQSPLPHPAQAARVVVAWQHKSQSLFAHRQSRHTLIMIAETTPQEHASQQQASLRKKPSHVLAAQDDKSQDEEHVQASAAHDHLIEVGASLRSISLQFEKHRSAQSATGFLSSNSRNT